MRVHSVKAASLKSLLIVANKVIFIVIHSIERGATCIDINQRSTIIKCLLQNFKEIYFLGNLERMTFVKIIGNVKVL